MRIVHIHQHFATPAMATSTHSYEMDRRLVALGHEVHIVAAQSRANARGGGWSVTNEAGIVVHWLPRPYANDMSYSRRLWAFFDFAVQAALKASSLEPELVYATSTPLTVALPAVYASKRRRVPMVFEIGDLWPEVPIALGAIRHPVAKRMASSLEAFAYRNARRVIAFSPGMKEGVLRTGYPSEKVTVIPNACDFELFDVDPEHGARFRTSLPWLGDRPLFVYTGTLGLVNGVDYLARIAAEAWILDDRIRFLVIGEGREEEKVRNEAKRLGVLDRNFFMMKPIPKSDMPSILSAADMASSFVIDVPELWHNCANKFFDALASSTPVAINYQGWQADLIRELDIGIVLPATDHVEAAQRISKALSDSEWLKQAGGRAANFGRHEFHRDVLAARLDRVLTDARGLS